MTGLVLFGENNRTVSGLVYALDEGIVDKLSHRILQDGRTKITAGDIEAIKASVLAEVQSIRGERAGTALPTSLNEALALLNEEKSQNAELEAEIERLRGEAA